MTALVSYEYCNKLPQTLWFKMSEIYSHIFGGLKSKTKGFGKGFGDNLFLTPVISGDVSVP
jgi:hypothetical protein